MLLPHPWLKKYSYELFARQAEYSELSGSVINYIKLLPYPFLLKFEIL